MSSPFTSAAVAIGPDCDIPANAEHVLPPASVPIESYADSLKMNLSQDAEALLGAIDDSGDAQAHFLFSPLDFHGRRVLVFWGDDPVDYEVSFTAEAACVLSPSSSPSPLLEGQPVVLIDPRRLEGSKIDFSTGTIFCAAGPEPVDGTHTTSHKSSGGALGTSSSKGLGGNDGSGGEKGEKKTPKKSGGGDGSSRGTGTNNPGINDAVGDLFDLPRCPISAREFVTWFPHHTKWPAVLFRLYRHGWTTGVIAKGQLHARGRLTKVEWDKRCNAMRHQLRTATQNKYDPANVPDAMKKNGVPLPAKMKELQHGDFAHFVAPGGNRPNSDLYDTRFPVQTTGDLYQPPRGQQVRAQPATLAQIINGVVNWPTGEDAGPVTQALQWAQANGRLQLTVDDLDNIIATQGFQLPANANTISWDLFGLERLNNAVPNPT